MKNLAGKILLNTFFSIGIFSISFYLSWQICASTNFLYPLWYEVVEIDDAIKKYAPKNKNRYNFEATDKKEHVRLFSGIVFAIQNKGAGLDKLVYSDKQGNEVATLLTNAEIIHLTDVSKLIANFKYYAFIGVLISLLMYVLLKISEIRILKVRYHLMTGLGLIMFLSLIIIIIGPKKVFYAGHDLIFPSQHQWFFYYEDSLMSTMMKAPYLFAPITIQLLIMTIIIWLVLIHFSHRLGNGL